MRAACADTLEIAITNNICSISNGIPTLYSLRSLSMVSAPRASRSVQPLFWLLCFFQLANIETMVFTIVWWMECDWETICVPALDLVFIFLAIGHMGLIALIYHEGCENIDAVEQAFTKIRALAIRARLDSGGEATQHEWNEEQMRQAQCEGESLLFKVIATFGNEEEDNNNSPTQSDLADEDSIDPKEFEKFLERHGLFFSEDMSLQIFRSINTSGDGFIDKPELISHISMLQPLTEQARSAKAFIWCLTSIGLWCQFAGITGCFLYITSR